jgi:type I restriction enzyme, R subunit
MLMYPALSGLPGNSPERARYISEAVSPTAVETGVDELDQEKLPILLTNKYQSLEDAKDILGDVANISRLFIEFQEHLYKKKIA